jgi:hypothetical protein
VNFQDLLDQYLADPELRGSSKAEYKPRIEKYLHLFTDISEVLDEKNLWDFIKNI